MTQNPFRVLAAAFASNVPSFMRLGNSGDLLVSDLHGSRYNVNNQGALFSAANQTGVTTTVALATTYVGFCLNNPAGSGYNLEVRRVSAQLNVAPAAITAFGLITGKSPITVHTTPLTINSNKLGSAVASIATVDAACTLTGTPLWQQWLGSTLTTTGGISLVEDIQGGLIIGPGSYVAIGTLIASSTSGFLGSMSWAEIPVNS